MNQTSTEAVLETDKLALPQRALGLNVPGFVVCGAIFLLLLVAVGADTDLDLPRAVAFSIALAVWGAGAVWFSRRAVLDWFCLRHELRVDVGSSELPEDLPDRVAARRGAGVELIADDMRRLTLFGHRYRAVQDVVHDAPRRAHGAWWHVDQDLPRMTLRRVEGAKLFGPAPGDADHAHVAFPEDPVFDARWHVVGDDEGSIRTLLDPATRAALAAVGDFTIRTGGRTLACERPGKALPRTTWGLARLLRSVYRVRDAFPL